MLGGAEGDKAEELCQWTLEDEARAELPLIPKSNDDRYPVGMALAINSSTCLPRDENSLLDHPMPILFLMTLDGILCGFYAVNTTPGAPQVRIHI